MAKHTSLRDQFLGFAGGHFMLSAIGVLGAFTMLGSDGEPWSAAIVGLLMLLYVPAGAAAAALLEWNRPTVREWLQAVALVGGVACLWGFGGFALCWAGPLSYLGFLALLSTAFLASPSFCLMVWVGLDGLNVTGLSLWPRWYLATAAAALLPPVLFFLGSLLCPEKRAAEGGEPL